MQICDLVARWSSTFNQMQKKTEWLCVRDWFAAVLLLRLSFYSGHSSFGMYCMLFLSVSVSSSLRDTFCLFTTNAHTRLQTQKGDQRRCTSQVQKHHCCYAAHCTKAGRWQIQQLNPCEVWVKCVGAVSGIPRMLNNKLTFNIKANKMLLSGGHNNTNN